MKTTADPTRVRIGRRPSGANECRCHAGQPRAPRVSSGLLASLAEEAGAEGKKKGLTTTLPAALSLLQAAGEIRRLPAGGRLDGQQYAYALWSPSPLAGSTMTAEEARAELARRFWSWTGAATIQQFRWFSAVPAKEAREAAGSLGLSDLGDGMLALPADAEAYRGFEPPRQPDYSLVAWLDGISHLRRDLRSLLDPADADRDLGGLAPRPLGAVADLPAQAIFDRGRLAGLWEFDHDAGEIVWAAFGPPDDALRDAVARTELFVRDELGDARGSSLDNPAKRGPKLQAIRAMAVS